MTSRIALIVTAIFVSLGVAASRGQPNQPLAVTLNPSSRADELLLCFSVSNLTSTPITLDASKLPWGNRYSVRIVAISMDGDSLPGVFPVDDSLLPLPLTLEPMKLYKGEVLLARHVDLSSVRLESQEIVVFWYYRPEGPEGQSLGEYGGFVTMGGNSKSH